MTKPTPGRIVWYRATEHDPSTSDQPMAAIVTYVHNDGTVNLAVFDKTGKTYPRTSVVLVQESDSVPAAGTRFCQWPSVQEVRLGKSKKA